MSVLSLSFLSTPSARRATAQCRQSRVVVCISIHALREEGDVLFGILSVGIPKFLSTPSARRATGRSTRCARRWADFYPRPPRGGRLNVPFNWQADNIFLSTPSARRATGNNARDAFGSSISIHALREEGDPSSVVRSSSVVRFLSTPSARRATGDFPQSVGQLLISIHALREEGDL